MSPIERLMAQARRTIIERIGVIAGRIATLALFGPAVADLPSIFADLKRTLLSPALRVARTTPQGAHPQIFVVSA